jgi:hypothetical protein
MIKSQSTIKAPAFGIGPPQIWPHLPALLVRSLPRFAAHAIRMSVPAHAMR